MAEIINLRTVRKRKSRAQREDQAQENRIRFGRTRAERREQEKLSRKQAADLDGHRLEPDDEKS
ncbi:DUF4169 family protein [Nitratireductor basaltis]|uniref:Uncharacterized protein n=1 Tax=Nitratireductor basaltis TaxID=472175 RepID=A0A084U9T6_9HYPH|nr:DUF4169 family protein [Nitratireductor basaltis]KFB09722.1 hypothetical protein EL18_00739 [Nitratireductor basaltis]